MNNKVTIIGAGCAGLSLANYSAQAGLTPHILTDKEPHSRPDHIWGFWDMAWLSEASQTAKATWHKWQICDHHHRITHQSHTHPYHAVMASQWLSHCSDKLHAAKGEIEVHTLTADNKARYFDSRPPTPPKGCLLQHFIGQHIKTKKAIFDPDTAILMDFRTDQSQGLHFIYLLPFSDKEALVESTLFTAEILPDEFYRSAIKTYLNAHYDCTEFALTHEERGAIPLCDLTRSAKGYAPNRIPIGAASGALRPSSGYGFATIQRQAQEIAGCLAKGQTPKIKSPHRKFDLWMDKVFLSVLETQAKANTTLFVKMAAALTGDEFASFMSGTARPKTYLKVILAMPKWVFIKSALSLLAKGR